MLEADEEVTIFFTAGVSPNIGISVGLQEEAVKISEPIMSLSLSLHYGDDLCFVSGPTAKFTNILRKNAWFPCNHEITLPATRPPWTGSRSGIEKTHESVTQQAAA